MVPASALTLHFHNTRGFGLCNVMAAYEAGTRRFDASLGGLGGYPFAPGAFGNICTEDLVKLCDEMGIEFSDLLKLSQTLPSLLEHELLGQVVRQAGTAICIRPLAV